MVDKFEDDYPVLDLSAQPTATEQPADDYPVLDPATIHGSNVPRPPEDDYPILNQEQQPRGVQTRVADAFQENYKPILDKAIEKAAPDFAKKHPIISSVLQGAISGSPLGAVDRLIAGVNALPSAAAGAVAGLAEKNPKAAFPIGLSRMEADRLQRDIDVWGKAFMFESGMGTAGALSHGRSAQIGDIGKQGLKDLNKQGQTPGSTAAPGVAQEPNPSARSTVADFQNKATLGDGTLETGGENLNTRDYGKTTPAATGEASGVNVGTVDPTLQHALTTATETAKPAAEVPLAARPIEPVPVPEGTLQLPEVTVGDRVEFPPAVVAPPPAAALDVTTANRMLNQPAVLRAEAAKRGVTPDVLKAQARETLATRASAVEPSTAPAVEIRPTPEIPAAELGPEGTPASLGAAAVPPGVSPASPPISRGGIIGAVRANYDKLLDWTGKATRETQMKLAPMATGSETTMALVKDHANLIRRIDYEHSIADTHLERRFNSEQRKRMWDAADEENVMRQRGEQNEHMGIATLTPEERAGVESFQPKARELWAQARDMGMVEGEGLPYYTPRMIMNIAEKEGGPRTLDPLRGEVQTTTPQLRRRKYMEAEETEAAAQRALGGEAKIARDIRTMPLALAKLEKAIAGRALINKIKQVGRETGQETVVEGHNPGKGWFTLDHPAFYTSRPRTEIADTPIYRAAAEQRGGVPVPEARIPLFDRNGDMVFDKIPIYIRGDFEGPLRSILTKPPGMAYSAFMSLKGKTMGLIMNSPMIHNAVEWGRAMATMPGKMFTFQVYFEGNAAKRGVPYNGTARYVKDWATGKFEKAPRNASPTMIEAIDAGLVPIGKRFFNQDISSIMEQPDLAPGRSLTAKVLGAVPGLFDPRADVAVRRVIDRAGDFWHNTLLWDRVGDLQMGLYVNAKRDLMMKHGLDEQSAARTAAHVANRYAGALPQEAMSDAARKIANFTLFSRSFTLGNTGVLKDMINGMPRDVRAQISRDIGVLDPKAAGYIKSMARRKAISIVAMDVGLMYIGNSLLQSAINVMRGDKTLDEEAQGYIQRASDALKRVQEHPISLAQPITLLESLSATAENEPGKQDRIMVGKTKDGQAIYMRNPVGKIGEEFVGYMSSPLDMLKRKLGTVVRPGWQIAANDKGFGQKIYNPHAEGIKGNMDSVYAIAKHFALAQTPEGQARAFSDYLSGQGDQRVNAAQAFGPLAGVTFSRGHPLGPAAGELARFHEQRQFQQKQEMPDIKRMIQNGDVDKAVTRMQELGIEPGLQRFFLSPRTTPRQVREIYRFGTPEQQQRFERARNAPVAPAPTRAPAADWQDWKPPQ